MESIDRHSKVLFDYMSEKLANPFCPRPTALVVGASTPGEPVPEDDLDFIDELVDLKRRVPEAFRPIPPRVS